MPSGKMALGAFVVVVESVCGAAGAGDVSAGAILRK
jgi:hypothetical protein